MLPSPSFSGWPKFPIEEARKKARKAVQSVCCYSFTNDSYAYPNRI
jgi:hypothetical protein